jgi:septal ring factor EnvC (AmiA/AmiB activator)
MEKLPVDSSSHTLSFEIADLHEKIDEMRENEKELTQKILTLTSKLEDERNINIRNSTLLEYRAEYIRTLQDIDNVNKARLVLNVKELEDSRKFAKDFEKFKAAHKEEKGNFKKLLKNLETENTRLKTKVEMYEKSKFGTYK